MGAVFGQLWLASGGAIFGQLLTADIGINLSLPDNLTVAIPIGVTVLHKDHPLVVSWLGQASAQGASIVDDCPASMVLSDSPVMVTFTATDGEGNQVSDVRLIYIQQSGTVAASGGKGIYKYVGGKHVRIGTSGDGDSQLIDT